MHACYCAASSEVHARTPWPAFSCVHNASPQVHDGGSDVSRADLRFDLLLVTLPVTASSVHVAPCPTTPPPQPTDAVVRGPYLIAPTVEGITVRWRTLFVGVGRVVVAPVGKEQGGRGNGVEDPPRLVWSRRCPGVDQEAVITGLAPGTQYKYMVRRGMDCVIRMTLS